MKINNGKILGGKILAIFCGIILLPVVIIEAGLLVTFWGAPDSGSGDHFSRGDIHNWEISLFIIITIFALGLRAGINCVKTERNRILLNEPKGKNVF